MKIIKTDLTNWADIIQQEIVSDDKHDWFWPKSNEHQIFEQSFMKFVNRNLNYFYFENMVAHSTEPLEYNPHFTRTLEFCRLTRTFSDPEHYSSPFGRMCVWKLPPNCKLLAHKDNYFYHRFITRNIFIVSDNSSGKMKINIDAEPAPADKGTLFQFYPDIELHEFINSGGTPFYFLGFDFWNTRLLQVLKNVIDTKAVIADPKRLSGYGGKGTKFKYISAH